MPRLVLPAALVVSLLPGAARGQIAFDREPILYSSPETAGPAARLQQRIDTGETQLRYDEQHGYLRSLRSELRARHHTARRVLRETMPEGVCWTEPEGGLALWVELPVGADVDRIAEASAREGVLVTPGRAFDPFERPSRGLRLSLSRVDQTVLSRGIEILARHTHDELVGAGADSSFQPPLIL